MQLQEIGPRFTLKLRSLKKGLPAVKNIGEVSKPLEFDTFDEEDAKPDATVEAKEDANKGEDAEEQPESSKTKKVLPPKDDEYQWIWKVSHWYHPRPTLYLFLPLARAGNH